MRVIGKTQRPTAPFRSYRPSGTVLAAPYSAVEETVVETLEGEVILVAGWDGMIVLDDQGYPFPVPAREFHAQYVRA